MNWIKWFCISLLPTRVLLRIQEAPLPTCRSNVAICISRTQARFVSTLYQLAVYLLGLGVLYKHCIGMPCIGVGYIVSTLYRHTQCIGASQKKCIVCKQKPPHCLTVRLWRFGPYALDGLHTGRNYKFHFVHACKRSKKKWQITFLIILSGAV